MTKIEKTPPPDPIALIREELADFEKQRTEAVQNSNFWQQKVLLADGAYQACAALLKKLDPPKDLAPLDGASTTEGSDPK